MIRYCITITSIFLFLSSCGKDCVTCKDGTNDVEVCEDLEYTDMDGNIISFDQFIEQERLRGIECK